MFDIGTLIAQLVVGTKGLDMAVAHMRDFELKAQKSIDNVNRNLETFGRKAQTFGRQATRSLTLPLTVFSGAAIKASMEFEASMTKVTSLVGVAREQMEEWSQEVLEIAPILGKAPQELADALFFVTSAGIRGAEAMDVLEASAKASSAGLGETKVVADLVTSAMNAYGVANLDASQALDVLITAVKEGKAEAPALAASLGQVLPIASNMGVTFNEVGAAVAAMTRTGTNAQTAAIQLRQILNSLIKPAQQAEDALMSMGTSSAELRRTIREQGLLAALMQVNDLTQRFGEQTMSTVFPNIRALSGVLDLMGANLEDNVEIFKSLDNAVGASNTLWKEYTQTGEYLWKTTMAEIKTAFVEIGQELQEAFLPLLQKLGKTIGNLAAWFKSLTDNQQQLIIRLGVLAIALGPASLALGLLSRGVAMAIKGVTGLIRVFKILRVVMMANPILAVATAITAIVVALIAFRKRANEATAAQKRLNEELERTRELEEGFASVEKMVAVAGELNRRQLEGLKDRIKAQIQLEEDAIAERVAAEQEARRKVDALLDEGAKRLDEKLNQQLQSVSDATRQRVMIEQDGQNIVAQNEARTYEERLRELQLYLQQVENLLKSKGKSKGGALVQPGQIAAAKTLDDTIKNINTSFESLDEIVGDIDLSFEDTSGTMLDMVMEMEAAKFKAQQLGDQMGVLQARSQFLTGRMMILWEEGFRPGDEAMNNVMIALRGVQEEMDKLALKEQVFTILANAATNFAVTVGKALSSTTTSMMDVVDLLLQTTQQIIGMLLMQSIMGIIRGETTSKGLPGLITAAVGVGVLMGMWDNYKARAQQSAGMAEGGMVPPGFPNDTYNARLTSGEVVLPKKVDFSKLQRMTEMEIVGETEISGDTLYLIYKRATEKLSGRGVPVE